MALLACIGWHGLSKLLWVTVWLRRENWNWTISPGAAVTLLGVKAKDLFVVGDPTTTVMIFPAAAGAAAAAARSGLRAARFPAGGEAKPTTRSQPGTGSLPGNHTIRRRWRRGEGQGPCSKCSQKRCQADKHFERVKPSV